MEWKKGLILGIIAGIVFTAISFTFEIVPGRSEWYAATFPQIVSPEGMWSLILSTLVIGLFMGLFYSVLNSAIPGNGIRKGINYGVMVWLLAGLMWPIMMMGFASVYMWGTELIGGLISYSITGVVIAIIYKKL